jgi:hypothetical protein
MLLLPVLALPGVFVGGFLGAMIGRAKPNDDIIGSP